MSHFTVLVIGNDPESKLAPYDENIRMPKYEAGVVSEEDKNRFVEYYTKEKNLPPGNDFDSLYMEYGKDWNGNCWEKKDGIWKEYSRYNPKSKWDWYTLGGRWRGFLKIKEGRKGVVGEAGAFDNKAEPGWVDQCKWGDVDFKAMRKEAGDKAGERYDKAHALIKGRKIPHWDKIRESNTDIEKAREIYNNDPVVVDTREMCQIFGGPEEFDMSRAKYVKNAKNRCLSTFAVVTENGEWYERGKMGWWGMVNDEKDEDKWLDEFNKLLKNLPPDTLVSIYDCHI